MISEKEFKSIVKNKEYIEIIEHIIAGLLDINFEEVHNNIIIDDSDIIHNENINYTKYRPYAIFVNYKNYIFVILKNNSKEDLFNNNNFKLANLISQEFPNKKIKLTNLNFF